MISQKYEKSVSNVQIHDYLKNITFFANQSLEVLTLDYLKIVTVNLKP